MKPLILIHEDDFEKYSKILRNFMPFCNLLAYDLDEYDEVEDSAMDQYFKFISALKRAQDAFHFFELAYIKHFKDLKDE